VLIPVRKMLISVDSGSKSWYVWLGGSHRHGPRQPPRAATAMSRALTTTNEMAAIDPAREFSQAMAAGHFALPLDRLA
jgi:hypothetical protein